MMSTTTLAQPITRVQFGVTNRSETPHLARHRTEQLPWGHAESLSEMHEYDHCRVLAPALDVVQVWPADARAFGKFGLGETGADPVISDRRTESGQDERAVLSVCIGHADPFPV